MPLTPFEITRIWDRLDSIHDRPAVLKAIAYMEKNDYNLQVFTLEHIEGFVSAINVQTYLEQGFPKPAPAPASNLQTFYVSLLSDLLGYYLVFEADNEDTVRKYLEHEYNRNGEYRLPWCAVYSEQNQPITVRDIPKDKCIPARCTKLYAGMFD